MSTRVLVYEPSSRRGVEQQLAGNPHASLKSMQALVGGYIESYPLTQDGTLVAILNEDGRGLGLARNQCAAPRFEWVGTFFVARVQDEHYVSLTDADMAVVRGMFDQPLDA